MDTDMNTTSVDASETTEAPAEMIAPTEPTPPEEDGHDSYAAPRGALAFVMALLIFYVIYWFVTYFEVFILRGA